MKTTAMYYTGAISNNCSYYPDEIFVVTERSGNLRTIEVHQIFGLDDFVKSQAIDRFVLTTANFYNADGKKLDKRYIANSINNQYVADLPEGVFSPDNPHSIIDIIKEKFPQYANNKIILASLHNSGSSIFIELTVESFNVGSDWINLSIAFYKSILEKNYSVSYFLRSNGILFLQCDITESLEDIKEVVTELTTSRFPISDRGELNVKPVKFRNILAKNISSTGRQGIHVLRMTFCNIDTVSPMFKDTSISENSEDYLKARYFGEIRTNMVSLYNQLKTHYKDTKQNDIAQLLSTGTSGSSGTESQESTVETENSGSNENHEGTTSVTGTNENED